jgi:hypothetical protein
MFAIAFVGVIMHELPKPQIQALIKAIKNEAGEDCLIAANADGIFASAPGVAKQVEMLFDSGIELLFLSEKAIARNSGRKELAGNCRPLLRPLNCQNQSPGKGKVLFAGAKKSIWMLSLTDQNSKNLVRPAHEQLDEFFRNKKDTLPVVISMSGNDLEYKKAIAWKYAKNQENVGIMGTGMHVKCGTPRIYPNGSWFIPDIGATGPIDSIGGIAPEIWWKRIIDRTPAPTMPDNSPVEARYVIVSYKDCKAIKICEYNVKI